MLTVAAWWVGGAVVALVLIWVLAKTVLPFAIGAICGAAGAYILINGPRE